MSRDFDPETDQFPTGDDSPGNVERPGGDGDDDAVPLPPDEPPPDPIEEPPRSPHVPDDPNPTPIGDPDEAEPPLIV